MQQMRAVARPAALPACVTGQNHLKNRKHRKPGGLLLESNESRVEIDLARERADRQQSGRRHDQQGGYRFIEDCIHRR